MTCPCGCVDANCCECCIWAGRPRTELEKREDRIMEWVEGLENLQPREAEEMAAKLKSKMMDEE